MVSTHSTLDHIPGSMIRRIRYMVFLLVGYALLLAWSYSFTLHDNVHSLAWISYGFLVAWLIRNPRRSWLPFVVGALVVESAVAALLTVGDPGTRILVGGLRVLMAVAVALGYTRSGGYQGGFTGMADFGRFILFAVVLGPLLHALLELGIDPSHTGADNPGLHLAISASAMAVGAVHVAPLVLYWHRLRRIIITAYVRRSVWEHVLLALIPVVLFILTRFIDGPPFGGIWLVIYGSFLALLVSAIRFGIWGTIATSIVAGLSSAHMLHLKTIGWVGVTGGLSDESLVLVQGFMGGAVLAALTLAVAMEELRDQEQASATSARRYRTLFHAAPVGLWELDLSSLKRWLDDQGLETEDAVRAVLMTHMDVVRGMMAAGVQDVNKPIMDLFQVSSVSEVKQLVHIELDKYSDDELAHIVGTNYAGKGPVQLEVRRTLLDDVTEVSVVATYLVPASSEHDWARWLVSNVNITALRDTERSLSDAEDKAATMSRLLLETEKVARAGSWRRNLETGEVLWSPGMWELYELDPEPKVTATTGLERVHPADFEWVSGTRIVQMSDHRIRFRLLLPGGRVRWIESVGVEETPDPDGTTRWLRGYERDITDAVVASENKSDVVDILESTSAIAYVAEGLDRAEVSYLSPGIGQYFFDREEVIRKPGILFSYPDGETADHVREHLEGLTPEAGVLDLEYRMNTPIGVAWFKDYVRRQRVDASDRLVFDGVLIDITAEKEAERLQQLERMRREVLLSLPSLHGSLDERSFIREALTRSEELTDSRISFFHFVADDQATIELNAWSERTEAEYCTASYDRHYPVSQAGIWADAVRRRVPVVINDYAGQTDKHGLPDGHAQLNRLISLPVLEDGIVVAVAGVGNASRDYTDDDVLSFQLVANEVWRLASAARRMKRLADEQERLRLFFDATYDSFVIYETVDDGKTFLIRYLNAAAEEVGGVPAHEALDRDMTEVYPAVRESGILDLIRTAWETGQHVVKREVHYSYGDIDQWHDVSAINLPDNTVAVAFRDITPSIRSREDAIRLEKELAVSQRMEALGRLAGGVAHDFNNLLGVIIGHAEAGQFSAHSPDKVLRHLEQIQKTALRSSDMTKQLLGFARRQIGQAEQIDMNTYLNDLSTMLKRLIGENITLHLDLCPEPTSLSVDPSFIDQIVTNLSVNSRDAIRGSGDIWISTSVCRKEDIDTDWPDECNSDSYICLSFQDSGSGMPENLLRNVFEPFFTTKEFGTGLGLSTVFGIVRQLQGHLNLTSKVGHGTRFDIYLPFEAAREAA